MVFRELVYSPEASAQVSIDALEIGDTEVIRRWSSGGCHITQKPSHWSNTDSMLEYLQEVVISYVQSERAERCLDDRP